MVIAERDDARRGALYFLGKTHIEPSPKMDLGLVNNFVGGPGVLSDAKSVVQALIPQSVSSAFKPAKDVIDKVTELIQSFFHSVQERIIGIFGSATYGIEWAAEFVGWGLSVFSGGLASAIPGWGYVQAANDLYSGVKQAVLKAKEYLDNVWNQRGVRLMDGMPQDIADALARHSAVGVAGGLKDAGIASVSIGLEAAGDAAGGAGTIVSVVTGILQRIANLIDWLIQRFRMKSVLGQAAEEWQTREDPGSLVNNQEPFNQWFRKNILCTPIVAALTLKSGFVGHPYRFLSLINNGDEIVSQAEFDAGVHYIEKLKSIAGNYVTDYIDTYRLMFTSDDKIVAARLALCG